LQPARAPENADFNGFQVLFRILNTLPGNAG